MKPHKALYSIMKPFGMRSHNTCLTERLPIDHGLLAAWDREKI